MCPPSLGLSLASAHQLSSENVVKETSARHRAVGPGSGSNVIPRRARPGPAGLRPDTPRSSLSRVLALPAARAPPPFSPPTPPRPLTIFKSSSVRTECGSNLRMVASTVCNEKAASAGVARVP